MLILSAKVAEYYTEREYTEKQFRNVSKDELQSYFPETSTLIEVVESKYENWVKHNDESKSLNYFRTLVSFDIVYAQRARKKKTPGR